MDNVLPETMLHQATCILVVPFTRAVHMYNPKCTTENVYLLMMRLAHYTCVLYTLGGAFEVSALGYKSCYNFMIDMHYK